MKLLLLTCAAATMLCSAENPPLPQPSGTGSAAVNDAPAWLGVALGEVDDAVAHHLDLRNDLGVSADQVVPGSPAAAAGLQTYDVIIAIDGQSMFTPRAVTQAIQRLRPGTAISLSLRRGAQTIELKATLAPRPAALPSQQRRMLPRQGQVELPQGPLEWSTAPELPLVPEF